MKTIFNLTKTQTFETDENRKIAHNRLYHDGYGWNNTWFIGTGTHGNKELENELTDISNYMIREMLPNGIKDIWKVADEMGLSNLGTDEFNMFCQTDLADYWIRLIAREGDYNIYLKAYEKVQ